MAEIDLRSPLTLSITITDWDSHLPSIETRIHIEVKPNLTSTFNLKLERIWFYCKEWDQFTSLLLAGHQTALTDMDSSLKLIISQQKEATELVIEFGEDYQENYQTSTALTCKLDEDALANLKQQFKEVPKWW